MSEGKRNINKDLALIPNINDWSLKKSFTGVADPDLIPEIIDRIEKKFGLKRKHAEEIVKIYFETLMNEILKGKTARIKNCIAFKIKNGKIYTINQDKMIERLKRFLPKENKESNNEQEKREDSNS